MASRRKVLSGLTRRQWGGLIAVTPLAVTPLAARAAFQVPAPATSATMSGKADTDVANVKQRLASIDLPMQVEPSFRFIP